MAKQYAKAKSAMCKKEKAIARLKKTEMQRDRKAEILFFIFL